MKVSHQKGKKVKYHLLTFIIPNICYPTNVPPKRNFTPPIIYLPDLATAASSAEQRLIAPRHASPYACLF